MPYSKKPKPCPHCGKDTRLVPKPRDLGLLLHTLVFQVPIGEPISEAWIETVRKHCRMTPERLAVLRSKPHARHWHHLLDKRQRRLDWAKEHNGQAPAFIPPAPGERDYSAAIRGLRLHWKLVRPILAKMKRRPAAQLTKAANRYLTTRAACEKSGDLAAAYACEAQWGMTLRALEGTLSVQDFNDFKNAVMGAAQTGRLGEKAGLRAPGKPVAESSAGFPAFGKPSQGCE